MPSIPRDVPCPLSPARPPLHAVTGLRFTAAMLVVLYHYGDGWVPHARWSAALIDRGYVGVSFFFVLSGMVLSYVYADGGAAWDGARRRTFWQARFARVYPVFALTLALTVPGFLAAGLRLTPPGGAVQSVAAAVTTPLMLHAWTPWTSALWNYPSWSLSVEAFLYALFPLLVPVLCRRSTAALVGLAAGAWALGMALPLGAEAAGGRAEAPLMFAFAMSAPLAHLPQFVVGACAGVLVVRPGRGLPGWVWDAAALVAVLSVGAVLASARPVSQIALNAGLLAPAFATLAYALGRAPGGLWARTVGSRPLRALGEISYALYLLQLPVWQAMGLTSHVGVERGTPVHGALYIGVLLAASAVVHVSVERPARRVLRAR